MNYQDHSGTGESSPALSIVSMKMSQSKYYILVISLLCIFLTGINAEDYQYQYFKEKKKFTPFSDYIPKVRLHFRTVPHYLEDYYELYGMKQYYNENSLRKNIARLKTALKCRFRHPSQALVKIKREDEYLRYRNLMFMHINILIMRNYLRIAARYDKRRVYFYNLDFAKEIDESLAIAKKLYTESMPYWQEAKKYAQQASAIKITTDLGFIESERYAIIRDELNYGKIITGYIQNVERKKNNLSAAISRFRK